MSNITYNFKGKVVLITGSSSGIGASAAILFAESGAQVVITSNIPKQLSEVAEKCHKISPNNLKPLQVLADVTKEEDLKNLVETTIKMFGKLDVLINNAGVMRFKPITDPEYMNEFRDIMQTNLYSSVYLTHLCLQYLAKTKGNVINICSIAALQTADLASGYSVSKSALLMFTKCMAAELGAKGIRVNSICPGTTRTTILEGAGIPPIMSKQLFDSFKTKYPIGRVGEPEDVAKAMLYLASVEASFITGVNFLVDGGHIAANVPIKMD